MFSNSEKKLTDRERIARLEEALGCLMHVLSQGENVRAVAYNNPRLGWLLNEHEVDGKPRQPAAKGA